jgi:UDP-glucose 4-epimerase
MKTLVTGGAGFIGSHLVEHLLLTNRDVIILDDFSGGNKKNLGLAQLNGSVEIVSGSVLDQDLVSKLMERSDQCYHLAASLGVSKINSEPFSSFNIKLNVCPSPSLNLIKNFDLPALDISDITECDSKIIISFQTLV